MSHVPSPTVTASAAPSSPAVRSLPLPSDIVDFYAACKGAVMFPDAPPFSIVAIWHDGAKTYIRSGARELPALYEEKDGEPSMVQYQVQDGGTYVIHKLLERGYLMVGKEKLYFRLANSQ